MSLLGKIKNIFREAADNAEGKLADTARDGKYAIEDAKAEVNKLTTAIANLKSQSNTMERELESSKKQVEKFQNLAKLALAAGNESDARAALIEKATHQSKVNELQKQVDQNEALYQKLLKQREGLNSKINRASSDLASLSVRSNAAQIRENIAKQQLGMESNSALSALDDLRKQVEQDEAQADALEEVSGLDTSVEDSLEAKYGENGDSDIEAELAALKAGN